MAVDQHGGSGVIFAPAFGIKVDAEGIKGEVDTVTHVVHERLGETWEFEVVAGGKRGATKNALIAHAQANHRRDPWYLNKKTLQTMRFLVNGLTSLASSTRDMAARQIGDLLLINVGENVASQKNKGGDKFAALTAGYAKRKQRKFGFTIPILKATGDLLGGLKVRISRRAS
jgi:hypothetical protein